MPKTKISEFSATAGNNTDIDGINIAEGCPPSGINDAIRELMAQLKDFQAGTAGDSFNGPVGTTTPAAGAFTNFSASGTFALTGDQVQISEGGTGQTTANAAFNALAPSQSTHAGKYLKTDGTNTSWDAIDINTADITGTLPVANGGTGVTSSTGTGSVVLSASPTFTGTVNGAALTLSSSLTLSGGTANGVAYLNGSKVLTTGSALTFDGTVLTNAQSSATNGVLANFQNTTTNSLVQFSVPGVANVRLGAPNADAIAFYTFGSGSYPEQMRLTSTGLGIGTSSPAAKLDVQGASSDQIRVRTAGTEFYRFGRNSSTGFLDFYGSQTGYQGYTFGGVDGTWMTINASGNLGLGVTPSAWSALTGYEIGFGGTGLAGHKSFPNLYAVGNAFYNGSNWIYKTTGYNAAYYAVVGQTGQHQWFNAASGTAGNIITFTQAMTLDASGRLGIKATSPGYNLQVNAANPANGVIAQFYNDATSSLNGAFAIVTQYGVADWFVGQPAGVSALTFGKDKTSSASGSELMRLDSSGNLGIGTTSPSLASGMGIAVYNSTVGGAARIALKNGSTGDAAGDGFQLVASGVDAYIEQRENGFMAFTTNNTERARITSGGDLLVGGTSSTGANEKFLSTTSTNTAITAQNTNASNTSDVILARASRNTTDSTFRAITYYNDGAGAYRFIVQDSGNVQNTNNSYGAISDIKLKENITDATPKLASLNQLRVVNYNLKGDTLKQIGLVAQEVEQVFPGLVETSADRDAEGNDLGTTTKSVKYSVLVPMLLKAVQELTAMNDDLRARVAQLEAK